MSDKEDDFPLCSPLSTYIPWETEAIGVWPLQLMDVRHPWPSATCATSTHHGRLDTWPASSVFDNPQRENMTLVIAALASDGIVVGSDSRETRRSEYGDISDDNHIKVLPVGSNVLVGVAGPAAWIKQEIEKGFNSNPTTADDVLQELLPRLRADPGIPGATMLVASAAPNPMLYYVEKRLDVGGVIWSSKLIIPHRRYCIGIPMLAEWFMRALFRPDLTVRDVAAIVALAIDESSRICPNICGGPTVLARYTNGTPWTDADMEAAIVAGKGLMKTMVLSVRRG